MLLTGIEIGLEKYCPNLAPIMYEHSCLLMCSPTLVYYIFKFLFYFIFCFILSYFIYSLKKCCHSHQVMFSKPARSQQTPEIKIPRLFSEDSSSVDWGQAWELAFRFFTQFLILGRVGNPCHRKKSKMKQT